MWGAGVALGPVALVATLADLKTKTKTKDLKCGFKGVPPTGLGAV